ncbi:hypothetical protein KEC46_28735 [Nocardia seriolae]|nr:hypothetical protein [Nocardia seriolae]QUN16218.1 hypothetical protein KEC46_28735 [Nocardia seriolae]
MFDMNATSETTDNAVQVEHRMRRIAYTVRWDPDQAVFIADSPTFPDWTHQDRHSAHAAVTGLKDRIRQYFTTQRPAMAEPAA